MKYAIAAIVLGSIAWLVSLAAADYESCIAGDKRYEYRVVDGDTIIVCGERVRLTGFDTPETNRYQCFDELKRGEAATDYLAAVLARRNWTIRIQGNKDVYGRRLGAVTVNGRRLSGIMISAGHARSLDWDAGERRRSWCNQ